MAWSGHFLTGDVMSEPGKTTDNIRPATAPGHKPVKPTRYDRRSVKEYEDEGLEQAVEYFSKVAGTFRKHTAKAEDVRRAIDSLPPHTVLQATMSDFWLRLTKTEGRKRRKDSPPPSPFVKSGRNLVAEKQRIADWDVHWLAKEAAFVFAKSGSSHSRSVGDLLRTRLPWITADKGSVLGCATELPIDLLNQAIRQPQKLALEWMTLEQALLGRWMEVEERKVWLARFTMANRAVVSEVERRYLEQTTAPRGEQPRRKTPLRF